jgi:Tol biopolymer transport system component
MIRKGLTLVLIVAMVAFGVGTYRYLGSLKHRSTIAAAAQKPTQVKPRFSLPGTMFLAQGGALFKLENGSFTQIASGHWSQPSLTPDHSHLIAVSHGVFSTDLYLLDLNGHVIRPLTHNQGRTIYSDHWSFYPRVSADGKTIFYSYDHEVPDNAYGVDLAVWAMPMSGGQVGAVRWTDPYWYSGGDVEPIPLASGGVLYSKFNVDDQGHKWSQLWLQRAPYYRDIGRPITAPEEDCSQPAVSPDGTIVAMVCTGGTQVAKLEVASFDGSSLGPLRVLVEGTMAASPAWSPDGHGIAYFAPAGVNGHFQLFYVPLAVPPAAVPSTTAGAATPSPSASSALPTPVEISSNLDFDTTAPPAWY